VADNKLAQAHKKADTSASHSNDIKTSNANKTNRHTPVCCEN
jgi:hypothetical protein